MYQMVENLTVFQQKNKWNH